MNKANNTEVLDLLQPQKSTVLTRSLQSTEYCVYLHGQINEPSQYYEHYAVYKSAGPDDLIKLYINSPGGSVYAGLAIYDTMQYISSDVATICTGMAASMGAVLMAAGEKGKRTALPHSRIMIHQPLGGVQGQASDIELHAREIIRTKKKLNEIYAEHTGRSVAEIEKDTDRDNFMSPEEAKAYGIIDEVITKHRA